MLITHIAQLGTIYNPANTKILLANLRKIYADCSLQQDKVNDFVAPYSVAVDNRESIFEPISKKITKLRMVYKTVEGVTPQQLEDFMTIARKLKGIQKVKNKPTSDSTEEQTQHSNSQMSYAQRTNNYDLLILQIQSTPNYKPNETQYKLTTLLAEKEQMLQASKNVANTFAPLNKARSTRNDLMYLSNDNLVDTFNKAKDYLFTILDANSADYKAIARIKFRKISQA